MEDSSNITETVELCCRGDDEAFSRLIDMYSGKCFGYFFRLSGNAADSNELLSKLFLKLVTKISSYKGGSFDGWIFTVASNIYRDHLRHQGRQRKLLAEKGKQVRLDAEQGGRCDMVDDLQICLEKLDEPTRELLTLRFYGNLSFKELAEIRSEPIGTTLSKVHRGLKKLRSLMEEDNA